MKLVNERQPLFHLYSYFTLILALLFLGFYFFEEQLQWWQSTTPKLLPIVLSGYLALAMSNVIRSHAQTYNKSDMILPSLLAEILLLGLLLLFLAPKQQDISIFMLISVGLGNAILNKRLGYFIAAMATLMVLSASYINQSNNITDQLLSGSFISILFFIESFIIQALKTRLTEAQSHVAHTQNQLHSVARISDLIIERMLTGVCVVDNSGKMLRINRAATERIGSSLSSEKKQRNQFIPAQLFERLQYWHESQLQNDDAIEFTLPDGSNQSIIVSFAKIDDASTLVFIEDKSTVARRAQQFKLTSLARMAASIAHEIRNPLNAISHASQLLQESEELNKEDKRLCDIILNHSNRMDKIIQNVLQISKRNSTEAQWIKLQPWVYKFMDDFKLQYDVPVIFKGENLSIRFDPSQLHQVLWNLCSNAVRHGKADMDNPIEINIGKINQRPYLSIKDNGNGIPAKEVEFLYEPFHTTSAQGTGLGLYLVKELCEANHAEISYLDKDNKGACFEISFARDYAGALEQKEVL